MPPLTPATIVDTITAAADRLAHAAVTRHPCAPVRDLIGSTDVAAAYGVQQRLTAARIEAGVRIVGRKIGLTSEAVQAQLGVDQPDFGVLFDDMEYREDQSIPSATFLQSKIEAEIAFVLGSDLDGDIDPATVVDAVSHAAVALEIVDSRIGGWDITLGDTVADNVSSGGYVLGTATAPLSTFRPVGAVMELTRNGENVSRRHRVPPVSVTRSTRSPGWPSPSATSASRCAPARSSCRVRSARWSTSRRETASPRPSRDLAR